MKLPMIPKDKANHLIYGLIIFSLTYLFFGLLIASIVCLVFAFGKELYDLKHKNKHTLDVKNALVTIIGGLLAIIIFINK